jgi:uncharacterized protein
VFAGSITSYPTKVMNPSREDIQRVTDVIVRDFGPQRVILFGSHAAGTARSDSDVDLLVVLPFEGSPIAMMSALLARAYSAMERPFALDIHPRRVGAVDPDPLMAQAVEHGIVLYEAAP